MYLYKVHIHLNLAGKLMEQMVFSPKSLGAAVRRQRKKLGLTQTDAGKTFTLQQCTVSSIEQGTPGTRLDTLFRMLAALDLEIIIRSKNIPLASSC